MFENTVYVKIVDNVEKYTKKAEELGYIFYADSSTGNNKVIMLWSKEYSVPLQRNYSIFNSSTLLNQVFISKELSQEEFFGVQMRKNIDKDVLELLVNSTCKDLSSFSAYDVTSILRSRLPSREIIHDDVKEFVVQYAKINNLTVSDAGKYLVYTNTPVVVTTTGTSTPVVTATFKDNFKTQFKTKLDSLLEEKKKKLNTDTIKLQSEGRINITSLVRKVFPQSSVVYITKAKDSITLTHNSYYTSVPANTNSPIRIRTGFKSPKVKINTSSQGIEITPEGN